jgi:uracil-DNA glycosylase
LTDWAKQGVFLLNSVLTTIQGSARENAGKHKKIGWEEFTDYIIEKLSEDENPKVFILWGRTFAYPKERLIKNQNLHKIIKSVHPAFANSYKTARDSFFGSAPFSAANSFLLENGREKINWA